MRDRPSEAASRPRRFRREIEAPGVGGADHRREPLQRRRRKTELLDHHVEGAEFAAMAPEHVFDVEGRGVEALGHGFDFGRRDEQEDGSGIDETADQPWAGDAIDLGTRSRDPHRATTPVAFGNFAGRHRRMVRFLPADMATFEDLGGDVAAPQPGRGAFAELLALVTDHDDGLPRQARRPILNVEVRAPHGARNQSRVGRKVLVDANIDKRRRGRRAYQSSQFVG